MVLPFLASTYCGSGLCVSFHLPSDEVFSYVTAGLKYIVFYLKIRVLLHLFSHGQGAINILELSGVLEIQCADRFIQTGLLN
jgi:hypothetical protein